MSKTKQDYVAEQRQREDTICAIIHDETGPYAKTRVEERELPDSDKGLVRYWQVNDYGYMIRRTVNEVDDGSGNPAYVVSYQIAELRETEPGGPIGVYPTQAAFRTLDDAIATILSSIVSMSFLGYVTTDDRYPIPLAYDQLMAQEPEEGKIITPDEFMPDSGIVV